MGAPVGVIDISGCGPSRSRRTAPAVTQAIATGTSDRGFHSNSRISTASSVADMGQLKVAAMPADAPATIKTVRSESVIGSSWPSTDPTAPPVMMTGPSAPNGPPEPIEIAVAIGFRIATRGCTLPRLNTIVSTASGIPCPRTRGERYLAMTPTIRPPMTGINASHQCLPACHGSWSMKLQCWK
jgi:hypothetical protein